MSTKILTAASALNGAFLKQKPVRADIEEFKKQLLKAFENYDKDESEENHKTLIRDFLMNGLGFLDKYAINTKGKNDWVIHNGPNQKDSVGVIIEAKRAANKAEMVTTENLNTKAMQELLLYYLRERFDKEKPNLSLKHLIITDFQQWFIFDAKEFETHFAENKELVKLFKEFEDKTSAGTKTSYFYDSVAPRFIEKADKIEFTWFNLQEYKEKISKQVPDGTQLSFEEAKEQNELIALFKILSPEHLLKKDFANDSNTLDKDFYSELLHIIGFEEVSEGGKKIITRLGPKDRIEASLIENTISRLDNYTKLKNLPEQELYGKTREEQLLNVARELVIMWVNRILFLKLLESRLVQYHQTADKITDYSFLNSRKVPNFDTLNELFIMVLARKPAERIPRLQKEFPQVPYLNSSLFELSFLEDKTTDVSGLNSNLKLPVPKNSVLQRAKESAPNSLPILDYFFKFLDAYDFSSEGSEAILEDRKTLINAAVLGLVFEKINGYQDGSFYTPGFITMYMCRETLRRATVQKFNETFGWKCPDFDSLDDFFEKGQSKAYNEVVNSLKICDPAVGSGHFLVSALNELLVIKSELKILISPSGKRVREYKIEAENDELVVRRDDGKLFEYRSDSLESAEIQAMLFHEKQQLIENCLFGVDLNPNSVNICRLRLWIELLKNAYYNEAGELETLPNIDINIKVGNSLVSLFGLNGGNGNQPASLKKQLKTLTQKYKDQVIIYKSTKNSAVKRQVENEITRLKSEFMAAANPKDEDFTKLRAKKAELGEQPLLFSREDQLNWIKKTEKLSAEVLDLEAVYENKVHTIYRKAFEWRFEFPEVLDEDGNFVGFDVLIGNPPYIRHESISEHKYLFQKEYEVFSSSADILVFFIEKAFRLLKENAEFSFVVSNKFMRANYGTPLRKWLQQYDFQEIINFGDLPVFEKASAYPCIIGLSKKAPTGHFRAANISDLHFKSLYERLPAAYFSCEQDDLDPAGWNLSDDRSRELLAKLKKTGTPLSEFIKGKVYRGILTGLNEAFVIDEETKNRLISEDPKSEKLIKPLLRGRDMKRYSSIHQNKWLIGTFPALKINIDHYPAIKRHLSQFKEKLPQTGTTFIGKDGYPVKTRKKTSGKWFEIQDSIAYHKEFEKKKIMYQVFQVKPVFLFDTQQLVANNSVWIIPKGDKVLLAILNSKLSWFLIGHYCTKIQNGYQLIWDYFGQIPIAKANSEIRSSITKKINQILAAKKKNPEADTSDLESEINQMVYALYELTPEEIAIVEERVK